MIVTGFIKQQMEESGDLEVREGNEKEKSKNKFYVFFPSKIVEKLT